jgi:hypothetical protein
MIKKRAFETVKKKQEKDEDMWLRREAKKTQDREKKDPEGTVNA